MWQLMCIVITTIWWRALCVVHVHGNYYYMVEGSPHMWLMCMVITTIYGGGEPSHVGHVWQLMCTVVTRIW